MLFSSTHILNIYKYHFAEHDVSPLLLHWPIGAGQTGSILEVLALCRASGVVFRITFTMAGNFLLSQPLITSFNSRLNAPAWKSLPTNDCPPAFLSTQLCQPFLLTSNSSSRADTASSTSATSLSKQVHTMAGINLDLYNSWDRTPYYQEACRITLRLGEQNRWSK